MFWSRKPRFKDVPAKAPELPRSEKIAFFAPHSSEHPAVMPLISQLRERLEKRGLETESHSVENMRDSLLSLSARLNQHKFSKKGKVALESFFRMHDAALRLHVLGQILGQGPEKTVVEVHALPRDYLGKEHFPEAGHYYRIPGTRILFPRDQKSEYEKPIRDGISLLEYSGEEAVTFAKMLLGIGPMELYEADEMLAGADEILRRTLIIEIPAPSKNGMDCLVNTEFEMKYGIRISEGHNLMDFEVQELLDNIS